MNFAETAQTATGGAGGWFGMLIGLIVLVAYWRIFTKAGEAGWQAIIPIWNVFVFMKVIGRPWWWVLLMLIPFVNIIVGIIAFHDLAMSFGHGWGFTLGLLFLPFIFFLILGFGGDRYSGPAAA
jgi:hypothetical protein